MYRYYASAIVSSLLLVFQSAFAQPSAPQKTAPHTYATAVQKAAPSVVNIFTRREELKPANKQQRDLRYRHLYQHLIAPKRRKTTLGSGVIMDKRGYILTNHHVVRRAKVILVALLDGRKTRAKVIGSDSDTDLTVLQIELKNLKPISIGDSDSVHVGDVVLAIGNPFGLGQSVTQGIISAIGRSKIGINPLENYIQTDAAINPGNSGGALINTHGDLIGVNTGIYSRSGGNQGIGFAIPAAVAVNIMNQIIKHGHVKRGWLGVKIMTLTPMIAKSMGTSQSTGVIVSEVLQKSPAARSALKKNDIITYMNQYRVRNGIGFLSYIAQREPGTTITLTVIRNSHEQKIKVKLGTRPATRQQNARGNYPGWRGDAPDERGRLPRRK